ncbi:hypothetical protein AB0I00_31470 [Streptomyces sp. NPDC050803]|uniref:hypothetical protein n=1 Tax=unclassified Streptomyces TaxID=2593676 RepID=UPI00342E3A2C
MSDPGGPRLRAGGAATRRDLLRERERRSLLADELVRVRESATAWRNGLAGLITALVGFSLIRGRSDIGQLTPAWARAVGVLLLLALAVGTAAAFAVLRAAHGRPNIVVMRAAEPAAVAAHGEALRSARSLRAGIALSLVCLVLLTGAVGVTWYGPEKDAALLRVRQPGGTVCGKVVRTGAGSMTLEHNGVRTTVRLRDAVSVEPVKAC